MGFGLGDLPGTECLVAIFDLDAPERRYWNGSGIKIGRL
jgi:hypothetical protein